MTEYKPGDTALYHEDGGIDRVEILENHSSKTHEKYKLRILKIVQESPLPDFLVRPQEIGEEFICEKKRGVACGGLWELIEDVVDSN